jgi:hypothetical protein
MESEEDLGRETGRRMKRKMNGDKQVNEEEDGRGTGSKKIVKEERQRNDEDT